ncbi:Sterol regulatory element-binding protein 1 [Geodia barretti]|uniref:Sterol regulatory element-binding protein 1 n=1 Tax=Geodia barretti TaxID=519541 RepID=A0AA35WE31_GEOBA|nr:Sterol regulatory element-binding protein 1 [Geodia barretti]
MRTLSSVPNSLPAEEYVTRVFWWGMVWIVRLLVAAVCFGWLHIRSVAQFGPSSPEGIKFWRFWKQAQQDLHKGEYGACRDSVELALSVINRPVPTSSFSLALGLLWASLSHLIFQVGLGKLGVYLASLLESKIPVGGASAAGKKHGFRVTSSEVAQAYHLLHQVNMTAPGTGSHLSGLGLYLAVNALNFAEADRPKKRLPGPVVSEIYCSLGLQSSLSLPHLSSLALWYYLFRSRNNGPSQLPAQLKWTTTPRGKSFLLNGRWEAEVSLGSRLYQGPAALPLYSVTRAFCKELLCESFNTLLLPPVPPSSPPTQPSTDATREQFKYILSLTKEATSSLLAGHGSPSSCVSGFAVIQWWASLGLVAGHWTAGDDQEAEAYYPTIEGMLGDSTPVPTALHLAFKALRLHKRPHGNQATPTETLLHLCGVTSNALQTCVTDVLQDHSDSVENELHQLGLLLACDWLLELRIALWEGDGGEGWGGGGERDHPRFLSRP